MLGVIGERMAERAFLMPARADAAAAWVFGGWAVVRCGP